MHTQIFLQLCEFNKNVPYRVPFFYFTHFKCTQNTSEFHFLWIHLENSKYSTDGAIYMNLKATMGYGADRMRTRKRNS